MTKLIGLNYMENMNKVIPISNSFNYTGIWTSCNSISKSSTFNLLSISLEFQEKSRISPIIL